MWRNLKIHVGSVLRKETQKHSSKKSFTLTNTYSQKLHFDLDKKMSIYNIEKVVNISTPLIVLKSFYI